MSKLKDGINDVSNADYHADTTYLSSTNFKDLLKDLEKFHKEKILKKYEAREEKSAFSEGSLVHSMILEPHLTAKEFAFWDGWRKAGKEWTEFKEDPANEGKILISKPQLKRCEQYAEAYKDNECAVSLIQGGEPELTICQTIDDVPVKIRTDYINSEKGYIADVKTTAHGANLEEFKMTIDKYLYNLSAAVYCKAAEEFYGKPFDFYFIVISKRDKDCQVFKASEATMESGMYLMTQASRIYKNCLKTGDWSSTIKEEKERDYEILEI